MKDSYCRAEDYYWGLNGRPGSTPTGEGQAAYITSGTGGEAFHNVGSGGASVENAIVDAITEGVGTLSNITLALDSSIGDWALDPVHQTVLGSWTEADGTITGSYSFTALAGASLAPGSVTFNLLGNGGYLDSATVNLSTSAVPTPSALLLCALGLGFVRKRRFDTNHTRGQDC